MYSTENSKTLMHNARASIQHGLDHGKPMTVNSANYAEELQTERACFVTLQINGQLRGCIGHLQAMQPLISDVVENAWAAAFEDPRFPTLGQTEFSQLEIHISILSPPKSMSFASEKELLSQIRPNIDGLILQDGFRRGTFLPSVWESLPDKQDFLSQLKVKAGLPVNYWSDSIEVSRYTSESITDDR